MATATYAGTNYALKAAPRVGTWPNAAACNGEVYCLSEECYATSDLGDRYSLMYIGILPVGAVVLFSVIWPIHSDHIDAGGYGMTLPVTGELGTATDPDLFGDVGVLNSATPQVIEPCPDSSVYTSTLDFALREETTVIFKTIAIQALADNEGIAVKIFYTMAGRTY